MVRKIGIVRGVGVIAPFVIDCFARAFEQLGIDITVVDLTESREDVLQRRLVQLIRWQPDFVLCYGHMGLIPSSTGPFFRVLGIPLAMLHFDCPLFSLEAYDVREFQEHPGYYYQFVWDAVHLQAYRALHIPNCYPIMLAADPSGFRHRQPTCHYDLTFVGRSLDIFTLRQRRADWSQELNRFVDAVIATKMDRPSLPVLQIWQDLAERELAPQICWPEVIRLYYAIHEEGSALLRSTVLSGITAARPHVFGGGWEQSGLSCHPEVAYGYQLAEVYAASRINLNITSFQLEQSVNNRIFDVAAVGGFLLTDFRADLQQVFPEFPKITYHTIQELDEKIAYYLNREGERRELAHELHSAVLARHTYLHRAQYILDVIV